MTLSLGFFAVSAAPASGPNAPVNDNYVDSLELNRPDTRLNRTDTLKAIPNTANATTQSDIFKPPAERRAARDHDLPWGELRQDGVVRLLSGHRR